MLIGVGFYMARKRFRSLGRVGLLKHWLEFHIFLCSLGPVLVLYHTTFKFGGLVALSFWSMVAVFLSGPAKLLSHGRERFGGVERLDCGGLLLGVMAESLYQDEVVPLRPGDLLLLFTDGVIERGGAQTQFEEAELLRVASAHRHLSAADLLGRITEELEREAGVPADDDTTLFILKAL